MAEPYPAAADGEIIPLPRPAPPGEDIRPQALDQLIHRFHLPARIGMDHQQGVLGMVVHAQQIGQQMVLQRLMVSMMRVWNYSQICHP